MVVHCVINSREPFTETNHRMIVRLTIYYQVEHKNSNSLQCAKKLEVTSTMFWSPQLHSFCVCDMRSSTSAYSLNQSIVEKLPSFVKLVSPFRKPINQHFR